MFKKITLLLLVSPILGSAYDSSNLKTTSQPDNSRVNKRDSRQSELTAQDQSSGSTNDVELTRKIRSSITNDELLSTNARNVKIITLNGRVTLKGPVENLKEKAAIEAHARKFAYNTSIQNELEVTDRD